MLRTPGPRATRNNGWSMNLCVYSLVCLKLVYVVVILESNVYCNIPWLQDVLKAVLPYGFQILRGCFVLSPRSPRLFIPRLASHPVPPRDTYRSLLFSWGSYLNCLSRNRFGYRTCPKLLRGPGTPKAKMTGDLVLPCRARSGDHLQYVQCPSILSDLVSYGDRINKDHRPTISLCDENQEKTLKAMYLPPQRRPAISSASKRSHY